MHDDQLGSVALITDDAGHVVRKQEFSAFGTVTVTSAGAGGSGVTTGFTGQEEDADLGLVNMRGRLYDADLGRFLTADPFTPAMTWSQGLNRYVARPDTISTDETGRPPHTEEHGQDQGSDGVAIPGRDVESAAPEPRDQALAELERLSQLKSSWPNLVRTVREASMMTKDPGVLAKLRDLAAKLNAPVVGRLSPPSPKSSASAGGP